MVITVYDEAAAKQVDTLMSEQFRGHRQAETWAKRVVLSVGRYQLSAGEIENVREYAVRQALETLRNRVDQFGVSEPTLQRQGDNRILIQLPGVKDPQRAIDLLGKTARLEFKMVIDDADPQDAIKGILPPGAQLLYEKRVDQAKRQRSPKRRWWSRARPA